MTACAPHREFLAAIADGETQLVPAETLDHVTECADCRQEIRTQQLLTSRLRQAVEQLEERAHGPRETPLITRRTRVAAAGVAGAILIAAAGGIAWFGASRPDPVQAAVSAATQPMQLQSTDPDQVGQWCFQASGRDLPAIHLDGMQVAGARMDRAGSTDIVTVVYTTPTGSQVTVSWLEGQAPSASGVEDRTLTGHQVLIIHAPVGTAVVMGSSADARWQMAAAIESTAA
ncbi:MAG TPA: hypothetical protein VJQ08_11590 [Candidatus Dormibacteraeota bacterium]|nr:hypothetical protein [Candidatus Dormibacteraeota bacterium]